MNSPPPHISWLQSLAMNWRVIILSIISIVAGYVVWDQPIPPTWVYTPPSGFVDLVGFTRDGRVVTIDHLAEIHGGARLRVRAGESGVIISDFKINDGRFSNGYRAGVISGDGKVAILSDPVTTKRTIMISIVTGEVKFTPLTKTVRAGSCSQDGRYVVLTGIDDITGNAISRIFDLVTGEFSWACEPGTQFTLDSQCYYCWKYQGNELQVVIRSLRDNVTILSDVVPLYRGGCSTNHCRLFGDRMFVYYDHSMPNTNSNEYSCRSYSICGARLSNAKDEHAGRTYDQNERKTTIYDRQDLYRGEMQIVASQSISTLTGQIRWQLSGWGLKFGEWDKKYSWQPISETGVRLGSPLSWYGGRFAISPSGDWLALVKTSRLYVWRLPSYQNATTWYCVFLAAAVPWGLWWILRGIRAKFLAENHPELDPAAS